MGVAEQNPRMTSRIDMVATMLLVVVALLVGGVTIWDRIYPAQQSQANERPEPPVPSDPISIQGAPTRGDRHAKVALVEFSDFECPYCGQSARDLLPRLDREYLTAGKVLLAWRHFPLASHHSASKAAEAAICAGRQGKFWDFHDWLFRNQQNLAEADFGLVSAGLGLDQSAFAACLDGQATEEVLADLRLGGQLAVSATPTWFVGVVQPDGQVKVTDRITGAGSLQTFQKALDKAIAAAAEAAARVKAEMQVTAN